MTSLLAVVAKMIGISLAKAIVKDWLRNERLLPDLAAGAIDVVLAASSKGPEPPPGLEKLSAQVAQNVREALEHDGIRLQDSSYHAVGFEVALTLQSANLDAGLLVDTSLDPELLARHLDTVRQPVGLSSDEQAVYERVLRETARALLDASIEIRGLSRVAVGKVLRTQDELLAKVTMLVTRPAGDAASFEQNYRQSVIRGLDRMELFGLPRLDEVTRRQSLELAFVTMNVKSKTGQGISALREEMIQSLLADDSGRRSAADPATENLSEPVDQRLARSRRLVIQGQAGYGKSTLAQWLAVRSARSTFPRVLQDWNNTVPLFIRLRAHAATGFPAPEHFPLPVAKPIYETMPKSWVNQQLDLARMMHEVRSRATGISAEGVCGL
ncbi:MAG: hypothetical protein K8F56_11370 [Rhodocyclaceae bacterium]|nr:hypothetical protein [Rhodocyclaceae bacterium]